MSEVNHSFEAILKKAPTGIEGLDDITHGGLPMGRPTLIVGGPGSGKTILAMEFLVNGARKYDEPGVFISFEESEKELIENSTSMGFDLLTLEKKGLLLIDHVKVDAENMIETGDYDLEGLFVRLGHAIDSIGAKRVALDATESIFSCFNNGVMLRSELRRLFRFLKDRGVTTVITGEKGNGNFTRNGPEEYVSDAVILLDNRVIGNIATRRLRIVKYRGSAHGSNEYPFLIDEDGFSVLPLTALLLNAKASNRRIPSGIDDLDRMLSGKGYYEGSTVLISGQAGSGKSSFAAEFIKSACEGGKKGIYITFEESPNQVVRNMNSIGLDLQSFIDQGLLRVHSSRVASNGLEMHLVTIHKMVSEFKPDVLVIDPISSLLSIGESVDVHSTLVRVVDYLKNYGVTSVFTDLMHAENPQKTSLISSLVDTWIELENVEANGETNRILRIIKSRGMAHSNQIREFHITDQGIDLVQPYIGPAGVLTGSARYAQEALERAEEEVRGEEIERLRRTLESQRMTTEAKIEAIKAEFETNRSALEMKIKEEERRRNDLENQGKHLRNARTSGGEEKGSDD